MISFVGLFDLSRHLRFPLTVPGKFIRASLPRPNTNAAANGAPIWVLATLSVVNFARGRPEMFQSTVIDITAQKKAQARRRDTKRTASPAVIPSSEGESSGSE